MGKPTHMFGWTQNLTERCEKPSFLRWIQFMTPCLGSKHADHYFYILYIFKLSMQISTIWIIGILLCSEWYMVTLILRKSMQIWVRSTIFWVWCGYVPLTYSRYTTYATGMWWEVLNYIYFYRQRTVNVRSGTTTILLWHL